MTDIIKTEKLTIGYNIKRVPLMPNHIMGKIYMRNPNPPLADGFTDRTYVNAILYVPRGSKFAYKSAHNWKKFVNINLFQSCTLSFGSKNAFRKNKWLSYSFNPEI